LKELLLNPELDPVLVQDEDNQPAVTLQEVQSLLLQIDELEKELNSLEKKRKSG